MKRFTRIQKLTEQQQKDLEKITKETAGYSKYGNRARVAVMLHLDNAKFISKLSKMSQKSPNEVINAIIETFIEQTQIGDSK